MATSGPDPKSVLIGLQDKGTRVRSGNTGVFNPLIRWQALEQDSLPSLRSYLGARSNFTFSRSIA